MEFTGAQTGETNTEKWKLKLQTMEFAVIAGIAVSEVKKGVSGMAGGFAGGISEVFSGKKECSKGIKVEMDNKDTKIDVNIIVEYGTRIPEVAFEIQNRVKKAVENNDRFKSSCCQRTCSRCKTDVEDTQNKGSSNNRNTSWIIMREY